MLAGAAVPGERRPLERALADPGFLTAFTRRYAGPDHPLDALRWLEDPEAPGRDGAPGPGAALRAAARELYRPGAGERQRAEHARLEQTLAASRAHALAALEEVARAEGADGEGAARGAPAEGSAAAAADAAGRRRRGRRLRIAVLVAAGAALLAVGASVWSATRVPGARAPAPSAADATASIAALIEAEPRLLPSGWRDAAVVSSGDELDGRLTLLAPAGQRGRLLLVVRCRASDRSFRAVISGGETRAERYGACGSGLRSVPLPVRPDAVVRVVVTTLGSESFSGALVRR